MNKLENIHKPEIGSETHLVQLRLTLLNAKRSAKVGAVVAIIPVMFLTGIFLKYLLHLNFPAFTGLENWMSETDRKPLLRPLIPLILIGAPLIGLGMNILAMVHAEWHKASREIIIAVKIKWANMIIIGICLLILAGFFFYIVGENCKCV